MSLPLPAYLIENERKAPVAAPASAPTPVVRLVPEPGPEPLVDEDALCVLAAQRGDGKAFDALLKKHQRHAFAIAVSLVRDEHDASEIVQEAFLRVHRGLRDFQGGSSFFTWLYRIVTNLSIDLMRKPQRRESEPLDLEVLEKATDLPGLATVDSDPFDNVCRQQLVARIDASVEALPPYHRGVIIMREIEGLSYEEMAAEMGVSKGTIMSRLFHARQKLQRSLCAEYEEQIGALPLGVAGPEFGATKEAAV